MKKKRFFLVLVAVVALLSFAGCELEEVLGPSEPSCDNTVQFRVLYHGNPIPGAEFDVAQFDHLYKTGDDGLTLVVCSGSSSVLDYTVCYGAITKADHCHLAVGFNLVTVNL